MSIKTHGRSSVTMRSGIQPSTPVPLGAALVMCHGWRSPERVSVDREPARGSWTTPLMRWTRPMRRAA